jgi:hypothetical protein
VIDGRLWSSEIEREQTSKQPRSCHSPSEISYEGESGGTRASSCLDARSQFLSGSSKEIQISNCEIFQNRRAGGAGACKGYLPQGGANNSDLDAESAGRPAMAHARSTDLKTVGSLKFICVNTGSSRHFERNLFNASVQSHPGKLRSRRPDI